MQFSDFLVVDVPASAAAMQAWLEAELEAIIIEQLPGKLAEVDFVKEIEEFLASGDESIQLRFTVDLGVKTI